MDKENINNFVFFNPRKLRAAQAEGGDDFEKVKEAYIRMGGLVKEVEEKPKKSASKKATKKATKRAKKVDKK